MVKLHSLLTFEVMRIKYIIIIKLMMRFDLGGFTLFLQIISCSEIIIDCLAGTACLKNEVLTYHQGV